MARIACLHTADGNIAIFDDALSASGLVGMTLRHAVRADLLAAAEREGGLTPGLVAETAAALGALCAGADAVLLTCSTLGPAAAIAARDAPVPVLRVDAALAAAAVAEGGRVVVLCAVETTIAPTRHLFEEAARATGAVVDVRWVPGAWDAFKAGDIPRYLALIAAAGDAALRTGATRVAFAQASMAGAAARVGGEPPPLTSPVAGLRAAAAAVRGG
ncbi:aspartate/glutamate racemase family protein [Methylobacterium indicum]|uniref:Asp/Glu racemase n=1 Tax=Methylobacterium indicum TaxID=1775910 RepID=A0A8H9C5M5_9HYPH|nr:aspartate/glutamate racemase family protein [Methylobacterium indicum]BCM83071.1 hypothetical protein mvi_15320 [Methylobacterium indicum]